MSEKNDARIILVEGGGGIAVLEVSGDYRIAIPAPNTYGGESFCDGRWWARQRHITVSPGKAMAAKAAIENGDEDKLWELFWKVRGANR